jgi:hypothetical protein
MQYRLDLQLGSIGDILFWRKIVGHVVLLEPSPRKEESRKEPLVSHVVSSNQLWALNEPVPCNVFVPSSSFPFSPPEHGWIPTKLPELATNGFPFAPTFIIREASQKRPTLAPPPGALPFGFHFRVQRDSHNQPVVDLTRGYYDPQTQVYTIPLCAGGGETQGGTYLSGEWTSKGDGAKPEQTWDTTTDYETD